MQLKLEQIIVTPLEEIIAKMMNENLLLSEKRCFYCNVLMKLRKSKDTSYSVVWKCMKYTCVHYQTTVSILKGSHFESIKIPIKKLLKIFIFLSQRFKNRGILLNTEINKNPQTLIKK
jgi:hypothetical protein